VEISTASFHQICSVRVQVVPCGPTDEERADMTELTVAFRSSFANATKEFWVQIQ